MNRNSHKFNLSPETNELSYCLVVAIVCFVFLCLTGSMFGLWLKLFWLGRVLR